MRHIIMKTRIAGEIKDIELEVSDGEFLIAYQLQNIANSIAEKNTDTQLSTVAGIKWEGGFVRECPTEGRPS